MFSSTGVWLCDFSRWNKVTDRHTVHFGRSREIRFRTSDPKAYMVVHYSSWISSSPPFEISVSIPCFLPITTRFGCAYIPVGDSSTVIVRNSLLGIAPIMSTPAEMTVGICMGNYEYHGTKEKRQDTDCVQLGGDGPGGNRYFLDRIFHFRFSLSGAMLCRST